MATHLAALYGKLSKHPQYLECIQSISYLPPECVDEKQLTVETTGSVRLATVNEFTGKIERTALTVGDIYDFKEFKESKLYMFPYSFMEVTAFNGERLELHLENFDAAQVEFKTWGYMQPDTRLAIIPSGYNKATNLDNALIINDFPLLPTVSSAYQSYLSRNKNQLAMYPVNEAASALSKAFSGDIGGATFGTAMNVMNHMAQQRDAKRVPNSMLTQRGGSGFNIANGLKGFTVRIKSIKPEYESKLSAFWSAYGYKVNTIKSPNLDTRADFNHIKTVGINITGNIPSEHMGKIKEMFNKGVTFWHDPNTFGDYTQTNEVK